MRRTALLAVPALLLAGCGGSGGDEYGAVAYCHQFIEPRLVSPSSADFPSFSEHDVMQLSPTSWSVSGYVDAENAFGASLRTDWTCDISYDEDAEQWTLDDLTGI